MSSVQSLLAAEGAVFWLGATCVVGGVAMGWMVSLFFQQRERLRRRRDELRRVRRERARLSALFPGERLVIPAGGLKVRSNDTDYRYRPHSAFAHLTGLGSDPTQPDLVAAVLQLIRACGLEAVWEGVETAEQAELLRGLGCLSAQGYFFSRPVPPEQIPGLLAGQAESATQQG